MPGLMDFRKQPVGGLGAMQQPRGLGGVQDLPAVLAPLLMAPLAPLGHVLAHGAATVGQEWQRRRAQQAMARVLLGRGLEQDEQEAMVLAQEPELMRFITKGNGKASSERAAAIRQYGLDPASPESGAFVLSGDLQKPAEAKVPNIDAAKSAATARRFRDEASAITRSFDQPKGETSRYAVDDAKARYLQQMNGYTGIGGMPASRIDAITEGSHAGLLFGYDDEISAGMLAPVDAGIDWLKGEGFDMGRAYDRKQKMLDLRKEQRREAYPGSSIAGEVAGGLALGGMARAFPVVGEAWPAAAIVPTLAGRVPAILAAPLEGAAYGALSGSGEAKPGERLKGAGQGALLGAAFGAATERLVAAIAGRTAGHAARANPQTHSSDDLFIPEQPSHVDMVGLPDTAGGFTPDATPGSKEPNRNSDEAGDFMSPTEPSPLPGDVRSSETARGPTTDVNEPSSEASKLFPEGGRRQVEQKSLERHVSPKGMSPRMAALLVNKDVRDGLKRAVEDGLKKGAKFWYDTEALYKAFIHELGEEEGDVAFEHFINLFAATSPASEVSQSIRTASYYFSRLRRGRRAPKVGKKIPTPYGHLVQKKHQAFVREYLAEMKWPTKDKPKIASIAEALRGNHGVVPVDMHAFRLVAMLSKDSRFLKSRFRRRGSTGPRKNIRKMVESEVMSMDEVLSDPAYWQRAPNKYEYAVVEQLYKEIAGELGLTPAEAQAAAWIGGAELTGLRTDPTKNFMQLLEERIMITAAKRNLDPRLVLKQFIRGEKPLLGLGAVLLGGAGLMIPRPSRLGLGRPQRRIGKAEMLPREAEAEA